MYVTQTYLGFTVRDAKAYVYFLSEDYMSQSQEDLHKVFLNRAAEFGLATGSDVAVVLPLRGFEASVLGDLPDEPESPVQKFYKETIKGHTPGLLVTRAPIDTKRGLSGAAYFTLNTEEHPFEAAKQLVSQIVSEPSGGRLVQLLKTTNKIVYLRPNLFGVGLDLNAILDKAIARLEDK